MLLYRSVPHWKTCDKLCQIFPKICRTSMGIQTHIPVILSTESREVIFGILTEVWSSNLGKPCVGVWLWLPTNGTRKVDKVALYEAKLMRLSLSNINQSSTFRQNGESCNVSEWKSKMRKKLKIIKFEQPVLFNDYGSKGKFNLNLIELTEHDTFHHEPSWTVLQGESYPSTQFLVAASVHVAWLPESLVNPSNGLLDKHSGTEAKTIWHTCLHSPKT